jgi:4-hydroxythreonine-4-phosphate dehydrogenase
LNPTNRSNRGGAPILGVTAGDPAGVGPEIVLKALSSGRGGDDELERARYVVIGPFAVLAKEAERCGVAIELRRISNLAEARAAGAAIEVLDVPAAAAIRPGVVSAEGGRAAADALTLGGKLCASGELDGLVTAPIHKTALHAAGLRVEGQTELLGELWGGGRYGMLVIAGALRVLLLTRHVALRAALDRVSTEGVLEHLGLLAESLGRLGIPTPRIAVAGFNPHAGEGGLFGDEDARLLEPAVAAARKLGLNAEGPLPADSLFGRAARGEFDGVLALYHDQGLIAAKAVAFDSAVTLLAGAPHLRVSVIHGAGFDIAGRARANPNNMIAALRRAAEWAPLWNSASRRGAPAR